MSIKDLIPVDSIERRWSNGWKRISIFIIQRLYGWQLKRLLQVKIVLLLLMVWIQIVMATKVEIMIEFVYELLLWRQQVVAEVIRLWWRVSVRNVRLWGRRYVNGVPRIEARLWCCVNKRTRRRGRVLVVVDQCCWGGVNGNRSRCCRVAAIVTLRERCRRDHR